ncbi:helix-turn-helix domain-containing protein [Gordonia amarae]|uniref:Helix-turn-helix domain-containing protein n=2 Tax=Gordonia amarae TaxID=36821 RepID=A0A857MFM1_9ACTN|nr:MULTISPECIES: helix-turn-helix transcriptional regulator [Gordonia]MCS3879715.1 transcriptional regulator with XRE-family HTH domain [Gordonia amarae]OBA59251.1 transcriptional regulator [Gordonia sp. 852002-10350_SCH5691597]QHN18154.1 helix-turn-helix domain-containing protein [Gordonia amarae]QHN31541.1 helix-turn-helix domain-containing protein [Gordonia amarae]QHN40285.1 helix-turn-helix domain-containing protein [Gordonia amarae]
MPAPAHRLTSQQVRVRAVRREALGTAIREARKAKGLTQAQVAEAAGLARSTVIEVERGQKSLSSDALWNLAVALDTPLSAIIAAAEADPGLKATLKPEQ